MKLSHWYHYYSDVYGPFLFHRCPKVSTENTNKTGGCWYYFKFILWFILIPLLTLITVIVFIFQVFTTFLFQPLHFEYANMNRAQKFKWRCPIFTTYILLSLILFICEVIVPILATLFCIPFGYFIHIYGFVRHSQFRSKLKEKKPNVKKARKSKK